MVWWMYIPSEAAVNVLWINDVLGLCSKRIQLSSQMMASWVLLMLMKYKHCPQ